MKKQNKPLKIPLAKPWFDTREARAAASVVQSRWLISGPNVEAFEKEFAKKHEVQYAVAVNSGSSALLVVQQAFGIGQGDEVIVPNVTFVSTASSSLYLGAKPVFVDIELQTYGMNPESIEGRITKHTKAIIPVHYAGQSCEMDAIMKIAKKYKLYVLEDAAEAHCVRYRGSRMVGSIGDAGIFSFAPSKVMTTGEGGMITTNNKKLAERCRMIRDYYDTGKFEWAELGFNFRMPDMMGAIGLVQLNKIKKAMKKRREIAKHYTRDLSKLNGIITPYIRRASDINFQLYTIRLDPDRLTVDRDTFIKELARSGIQARLYFNIDKNRFCAKIER